MTAATPPRPRRQTGPGGWLGLAFGTVRRNRIDWRVLGSSRSDVVALSLRKGVARPTQLGIALYANTGPMRTTALPRQAVVLEGHTYSSSRRTFAQVRVHGHLTLDLPPAGAPLYRVYGVAHVRGDTASPRTAPARCLTGRRSGEEW